MATVTRFDEFVQWLLDNGERPDTDERVRDAAERFAGADLALVDRLVQEWDEL